MADSSHDQPKPLRRLLELIRLERADLVNLMVYALVVGLLSLVVPIAVQSLVGIVSSGVLLQPGVLLIVFVIAGSAFSGWVQLWQVAVMERIQQRIFVRTAFDFASRIPRWKLEALAGRYLPEIPNRFFDVLNIQKGLAKVASDFVTAALQFLFGLVLLTLYHPSFILFGVVILAAIIVLFRITGPKAVHTSLKESGYKYKVAAWLQDMARALPADRLTETACSLNRTDELVSGYVKERQAHFRVLKVQFAALFVFKTLIVAGLLLLGSFLVTGRQISLGQFVAAELVIVMVLASVEKIVLNLDAVYDLLTGLEKVGQVIDIPLQAREGLYPPAPPDKGLAVQLDHLSMWDDNQHPLLRNGTFTLEPGDRVGLVSDHHTGTRQLIQLIAGIRSDYDGRLAYDGWTAREIRADWIHSQVSATLGLEALHEGNLAFNVTPSGREEELALMQPILQGLGLDTSVEKMPQGWKSPIVPGGEGMDSCLGWRLLMARAAARHPRLLIIGGGLDEQNPGVRNMLMRWLCQPEHSWTLLVNSKDPEILRQCKGIIVLRNGEARLYRRYEQALNQAAGILSHSNGTTPILTQPV